MRRGFTLLEVIVAVSLVLALGALVMPAVSRRIAGATGESVSRQMRAAIADARADAVRESRTLRVEAVTDPVGGAVRLVAREFEAGEGGAPVRFVGPVFDEGEVGIEPGAGVTERLVMELPRRTRVSREAPVVEIGAEGVGGEETFSDAAAEGAMLDGAEAVCVGVLLPTGGAVAGAPVYLTLPGSWTLVVSLDTWSGAALVERWEPPVMEDEWEREDVEATGER